MLILGESYGVSFDRPAWLLVLLIVVPFIVLVAWKSAAALEPWRWRISMALRIVVASLLLATLAQPILRREATDRTTILVIDDSSSIPPDARARAEAWLREAGTLDRLGDDRLGVVSAGRNAVVRSLPARETAVTFDGDRAESDSTNLERSLRLALALAPVDAATRLVIASDGNETSGDLSSVGSVAAALGIPIDVLPIPFRLEHEVMVDSVDAPTSVRPGTAMRVRVVLRSAAAARGRLRLELRGATHEDLLLPVEVQPGLTELAFRAIADAPGTTRIRAVFEPETNGAAIAVDSHPGNNVGEAITFVRSGAGRVLILSPTPDESDRIERALRDADLEVVVERSSAAPTTLAGWAAYDAVVMVNQPVWEYSAAQQSQIPVAVHDLGLGLTMIGGPDAYGAGAWSDSELARALPLKLEPPVESRQLRGALAIVIDVSGSMGQPVPGTNASRIDLASEAAVAALESLSSKDHVAVVAFAGDYVIAVPLGPNDDPASVKTRIRTAAPGGGTNLFPALTATGALLAESRGGVRHVLVISDGETSGSIEEGVEIARTLERAGITVTTVGIAEGAGAATLRSIAQAGGGQFHPLATGAGMATLPRILIREAMTLRRTLISEGASFSPVITTSDRWLADLAPLPEIRGYVVAADRGGLSEVLLRGPESDPIFARWQYGLGRVACFTSDASPRWTPAWSVWSPFDAFWSRVVQWTLRPAPHPARLEMAFVDDQGILTVDLRDPDGAPLAVDGLIGRLVTDDSNVRSLEFTREARGLFKARVDLPESSSYVVSARWSVDGKSDGTQAAFIRPVSLEERTMRDDSMRLVRLAGSTGGRVLELSKAPESLFSMDRVRPPVRSESAWPLLAIIAGALVVVDVATRRLHFTREAIGDVAATFKATTVAAPIAMQLRRGQIERRAPRGPE